MTRWPEGDEWLTTHRATLYNWLEDQLLPLLTEDGVWLAPDPAPLPAEDVALIFQAVADGPNYKRQNLATRTNDHMIVTVYNGVVTTEPEGKPTHERS